MSKILKIQRIFKDFCLSKKSPYFASQNYRKFKNKEARVQVILECTEHKSSGMPGTSRL